MSDLWKDVRSLDSPRTACCAPRNHALVRRVQPEVWVFWCAVCKLLHLANSLVHEASFCGPAPFGSIVVVVSCDVLWHHLRLVGHHIFSAHVLPFGIHNHLQLRLVPSLSLGWDECILDWRHSFMITSRPCFSTSIEEGPCPRFHLRSPFRKPSVGSESCLHLPSRLKYLPLRLAHFFLITSMIFCTQSVTINLEN